MHTNTARSISDLPSALKKSSASHSLHRTVTVTKIIKHKDMLITLTKENNVFISTYLLSSKKYKHNVFKKSKLYSHVYEVYISLVLDIYIFIYIYIYGDIYTQFKQF